MNGRVPDADTLRRIADRGTTDADLLARFAAEREELAFGELVRRHGPLVYRECLRGAGPDAADDAFQATFLILARKAGRLDRPERLAGWLFGVASRVARRARRQLARRRSRERVVAVLPDVAAAGTGSSDWQAVVHEELARLPDVYRAAVVLCDLEGHTRREAARLLGVPDGTLSNRLARARALLGRRLLRRGIGPGVLAGLAVAATPPELHAGTVELAKGGVIPPRVRVLAAGTGTRAMLIRAGSLAVAGFAVALMLTPSADPRSVPVSAVPADPPPDPKPVEGHSVLDLAVSPDGKLLTATEYAHHGAIPTAIRFFDATTFKEVRRLTAPDHVVGAVQFAPGGKAAFVSASRPTAEANATVTRVDVDTWKVLGRLDPAAGHPFEFTLSPDGQTIAVILQPVRPVNVEGRLRKGIRVGLYDATTFAHIRDLKADAEFGLQLSFAPDGKALGVTYHTTKDGKQAAGIVEFDPATGKELRRCTYTSSEREASHRPRISRIVYSPDGKRVVIVGGTDIPEGKDTLNIVGDVRYWDRQGGYVSITYIENESDAFTAGLFSRDGKRLYLGSRGANQKSARAGKSRVFWRVSKAQCWDTTGADWTGTAFEGSWFGEIFWTADGEKGHATAMALDPTGTRLLLADDGGVWVFDAATGQRRGGLVATRRE